MFRHSAKHDIIKNNTNKSIEKLNLKYYLFSYIILDRMKTEQQSKNFNFKTKSLKAEDIVINNEYTFTINMGDLRDSNTEKCNDIHIKSDIIEKIEKMLRLLRKLRYCKLTLHPEFSPIGILHFFYLFYYI